MFAAERITDRRPQNEPFCLSERMLRAVGPAALSDSTAKTKVEPVRTASMYETVLVATDSSDESRAALAHAVDLAAAVGATVHVVTVLEVRGNPMTFGVGEVDALSDAAEDLLAELRAVHDGRPVDIESTILRGKPANTLLEYAAEIEADIIVAGQRGAGGITGTLLGSTTDRLARLTDRPLVVVPAESDGEERN